MARRILENLTQTHTNTHGTIPGRGIGLSPILLPDNTPANPLRGQWGRPIKISFRVYFHASYSITFHVHDESSLILLLLLNQPITILLVINLVITMEMQLKTFLSKRLAVLYYNKFSLEGKTQLYF